MLRVAILTLSPLERSTMATLLSVSSGRCVAFGGSDPGRDDEDSRFNAMRKAHAHSMVTPFTPDLQSQSDPRCIARRLTALEL